jgi:hypothetical protein
MQAHFLVNLFESSNYGSVKSCGLRNYKLFDSFKCEAKVGYFPLMKHPWKDFYER